MNANRSTLGQVTSRLAASLLLLAAGGAFAQAVNLTAAPTATVLPDGQSVPMWGYSCNAAQPDQSGLTSPAQPATCAALSTKAGWSPVQITVPYVGPNTSLTINLTNGLSFNGGATKIATSIVIVGQLGGGLGDLTKRTTSDPIQHPPYGPTWPASGDNSDPGATFTPPEQGPRVKSLATEVAAGATTALTWSNLRPGTYLIHSGTHPSIQHPMGLYGVLVVTSANNPGVAVDKDLSLLFSEIDPAQNQAVADAVNTTGFSDVATYSRRLADSVNSILVSDGGKGYTGTPLVTIDPPPCTVNGTTCIQATATATVAGGSVSAVDVVVAGKGYRANPGVTIAAPPSGPGNTPAAASAGLLLATTTSCIAADRSPVAACYPAAVNYDPRYYLINGVSFDRTNLAASTLSGPSGTAVNGKVLLRLVNAGLRMHVPQVVGSNLTLYAEDGNLLPGNPRVQSSVFMAAGKTYDVTIKAAEAGAAYSATYPVYDRQLSLSTNNQRDGGMQAYIKVGDGGSGVGTSASAATLSLASNTYYCVAGSTLAVSDPAKGVLAGATGANGAVLDSAGTTLVEAATGLSFQSNGTFTYTTAGATCGGTLSFKVNNSTIATATITQCDASTPGCSALGLAPTASDDSYTSKIASRLQISVPGVLLNDSDPSGLPLTAELDSAGTCIGLQLNADGSFSTPGAAGTSCQFTYKAKNSQKTASASATVTVNFPSPYGLNVAVLDAKTGLAVNDYRWIIEEDRTVWIDPKCQVNSTGTRIDSSGQPCPPLPVESQGYNFHTANMPVVAQGCVGTVSCESGQTLLGAKAVCDVGNGACRTDADMKTEVKPDQVVLDPTKRYFISVLPGDGVNPVIGGAGGPDANGKPFDIATACGPYTGATGAWEPGGSAALCGHAMGGSQIPKEMLAAGLKDIKIKLQQTPLPTAKIAVFVFEDDNPLNGENDAGGGVDIIAPNEPGLGGFEIKLFDQAGGLGDATGQITYDMFNMPVSNALAGTIDPVSGQDACPITAKSDGVVGMIPTCPKYMKDGKTPSPLAGQALIANLYPGLYEIVATPAADRIARGEEWLQTNTLDGGKAHEAFIKPNEPGYFQEFGPGGFHVAIGFANPKIINDRKMNAAGTGICDPKKIDPTTGVNIGGGGLTCDATVTVQVANAHMARTPDQRIFSSNTYDHYGFTQCYLALGPADGGDFAFAKCDGDGKAKFENIPKGDWKLTIFDQWNDIMLDGLVQPIRVDGSTVTQVFPATQWRTNLYTRTYLDQNGDGVSQEDEPGLPLVSTNIRYRDGSFGFFNNTDLNGYAGFNEVFPFMNWLVVEPYATRYKVTNVHTVHDTGGPVDGTPCDATAPCGSSTIAANLANTKERFPLPKELWPAGSRYCDTADCVAGSDTFTGGSSGRIDPGWAATQGWQGLLGQNTFIEWGMKPFIEGENGGINGHVIYASTRPFDDPALLLQLSWEPGVPRVQVNLYQQGTAPDGSKSLKLVDTTTTSSFDDWAQGFQKDAAGNPIRIKDKNGKNPGDTGYITTYAPNMNCPGQDPNSPFFQTLKGSKQYLDPARTDLPYDSQFKCYDGWSQLNQVQPAPYDGMYSFPSVKARNPQTGKVALTDTNCTICVPNPDDGQPMLPAGKYIVEVIVPAGYELVKEEDKNILLGDVYVAPVTQQFAGLGNIFIMPDQAAVNAYANRNNPLNQTTNLGANPRNEGDTGSVETFWPCVGAERVVPDFNSLFPGAGQNAPFAGAKRPLCDRKEVALGDQMKALVKFYVFSSTHIAGHFTGTMTNDFASEFDPFSPQFGEKFGPPNLPVGLRDFAGTEVARVYADQWGIYNGLYFSSYAVNPPNPTGYVPQMAIACMNDPGPILDTRAGSPTFGQMITDPSYNPAYSNFCYETPFMPGFTAYMDTPVIPTMAFAEGYNLPDCDYPDATPAIKRVDWTGHTGPWVPPPGAPIASVSLTNGGSGYTSVPSVTFGTGGSGATAAVDLKVNAVTVTDHPGYYAGVPTVQFAPTGASATAHMKIQTGSNTVLTLTGGSGYTSVPTLTFPGGTGAAFNVTMNVSAVVLSNAGAGYTSRPSASFNNGGTGGSGAAASNSSTTGTFMSVTSIIRSAGGSSYVSAPAVSVATPGCTINGTTCVRATAHAVVSGGAVTSFVVDNAGAGYTSRPTVTITNTGSGGTGAAAANAGTTGTFMSINRVVMSAAGSGYTSRPAVTFTAAPSGGTTATATNTGTTSGTFLAVNAVDVTNGGRDYTSGVGTFSGGAQASGGVAATITAKLDINDVTISSGGVYTAQPAVTFFDGGHNGSPTPATATMAVNSITLTSGGGGYIAPATATLSAPTGCSLVTCATATASATLGTASSPSLTIMALGDKSVLNPAYSGPNATASPFNTKNITRHYGFGSTQGSGSVTIGGVPATVTGWSDTTITINVPDGIPLCSSNNSMPYKGDNANARCGELVITAGNGKKSIDAITVTIGGRAPTAVVTQDNQIADATVGGQPAKFGPMVPNPLQRAIDAANPGDLIIVEEGTYKENLIMWKPVRLQGVGAASVTINADAHPSGKMDAWRRQVNCVFGLTLDGRPMQGDGAPANAAFDASGTYACPKGMQQQADRIPFEGILGWDVTVNGNLAQLLQEPTLMGAYEGAGVTVLGKGVAIPSCAQDPTVCNDFFGAAASGGYPAGYRWLNGGNDCAGTSPESSNTIAGRDYKTANFLCNPSRIDGVSVINSSQGGGAVFLHAWNHFMEISNNRISANHGTLTGGITIGTGEFPDPFIIAGDVPPPYGDDPASGLVVNGLADGEQAGYGFQRKVSVHHNSVTANASVGDALFSGTPSGAGGVTFCVGSDYYKFNNNWICGNLSTGDGAGVTHSGFTNNGTIANNYILFNQSVNPTLPTNGGGIGILGASPDRVLANGLECGALTDQDCPPGLPEGTGRNLVIDANLIMGNSAESGSGGGIRMQMVNGLEVPAFPADPSKWYGVTLTNNIVANNVAGWDGGGVSMQDALNTSFINNTVIANDTTGSAGSLFKTIGSAFAATPPPGCNPGSSPDASCYGPDAPSNNQPAGLVTMAHTPNLIAALPATGVTCPAGYGYGGTLADGSCRSISLPKIDNNLIWQNRAFHIEVGGFGSGAQNKQNVVTLVPQLNQGYTGDCQPGVYYWDIGVRGDTTPLAGGNKALPGDVDAKLSPRYSLLTSTTAYGGENFTTSGQAVNKQYCNGARIPPENCGPDVINSLNPGLCRGFNAPAGQSEFQGLPSVFTLTNITPAATVDEGKNWINLTYGPLTLNHPVTGATLGDYTPVAGSPAIDAIVPGGPTYTEAPATDFFGNQRKVAGAAVTIGAVELAVSARSFTLPAALAFDSVSTGTTSDQTITLTNGAVALELANPAFGFGGTNASQFTVSGGTCAANTSLAPAATCTITVRFSPTGTGSRTATLSVFANAPTQTVALSGTAAAKADLAITKTDGFSSKAVGSAASYTILVTNNGPAAVTGATITENLPGTAYLAVTGWSCTASSGSSCTATGTGNNSRSGSMNLLSGGTATYTLAGTVGLNPPTNVLINTVVVAVPAGVVDLDTSNNSATDTDTIVHGTASFTLATSPGTLNAGAGTLAFGNLSGNVNSVVTVSVAAGQPAVTFGTAAVTNGTGAAFSKGTGGQDTCSGNTIAAGSSCTIRVNFSAPTGNNPRTGTLSVPSNGTTTPITLSLSGS